MFPMIEMNDEFARMPEKKNYPPYESWPLKSGYFENPKTPLAIQVQTHPSIRGSYRGILWAVFPYDSFDVGFGTLEWTSMLRW